MLTEQQYRTHPNSPALAGEGREVATRKRGVRRTALWLAALAAVFYLGFIALGVMRSMQ